MISPSTIDEIDNLPLHEVISHYIRTPFKKSGSNFMSYSPWGEEKTPSFSVHNTKNCWNDFSSGRSGAGAISFVQEFLKLTFPEAVKDICQKCGIQCKEEKVSPEQIKQQEKRNSIYQLNESAARHYRQNRAELSDDHRAHNQLSRFSEESLIQFGIGYSLPSGIALYNHVKDKGLVIDYEGAGLLKNYNSNYRDFFIDRVTFEIHDPSGRIVGFAGRSIKGEGAKYINSPETVAFKKDEILYALHAARQAVIKEKRVFITEGYTDVIACHEAGLTETVATMGTALSVYHVNELKKITSHVILMRDGDAAGLKAINRDIPILLERGLKVSLVLLPENKDPYELLHDMTIEDPLRWIEENIQDAVLFQAKHHFSDVDPYTRSESIELIVSLLDLLPDAVVREDYRKRIIKDLKIKAADIKFKEEISKATGQKNNINESGFNLPEGIDLKEAIRNSFYPLVDENKKIEFNKTGYYVINRNGDGWEKVANFIIRPKFHKNDNEDNTRIIELDNGYQEPEIVEMPSSALISRESFRKFCFEKGPYFFWGTGPALDKIIQSLLNNFPKAYELKTLGQQKEGFFAYHNIAYNGTVKEYDNLGLIEHDGKKYFSPASSDIHKDLRQDDDLFENDRFLVYIKSPVSLEKWMQLMVEVYGDHSFAGIPYIFISLFRDIVFKVDSNFPFLYCYGPSKSGKSKFGESLSNFFSHEMPAFNLNTGTDFAFFNRLSRFRNCIVIFNEVDDTSVRPEWFQALKGAYDGEGRERGKGSRNKTEIQKVNSALILQGQYLSTKDDNSIVSRSILRSFRPHQRNDEEIARYDQLKKFEKEGITSLPTDLLPYRNEMEKEYYTLFNATFKDLRNRLKYSKMEYEDRVLRNYCALATIVNFFKSKVNFPWEYEEYLAWVVKEVTEISELISQSDILTDFWNTIQLLFDKYEIQEGTHFKIETRSSIRISENNTDVDKQLDNPVEVLYLRLTAVQKMYAERIRKEGGKMLTATNLSSYLKNREYYLGNVYSEKIGGRTVSCILLDYEALGISLEKANSYGSTNHDANLKVTHKTPF